MSGTDNCTRCGELRAKLKEIEDRWYASNRAIVAREKEIEQRTRERDAVADTQRLTLFERDRAEAELATARAAPRAIALFIEERAALRDQIENEPDYVGPRGVGKYLRGLVAELREKIDADERG